MADMQALANAIGVKLDEEFQTSLHKNLTFKITETGVFNKHDGRWVEVAERFHCCTFISDCFRPDFEVIKKPFKPEPDEIYFYIGMPDGCLRKETFGQNLVKDIAMYALGNCFKTKDEAIRHRQEVVGKFKALYGTEEK